MAKPIREISAQNIDARTALLNAAANQFARQGYSATGVQQITDAAGVNKAMLYYYFDSKDGIYDLLITEGIHAVEAAVAIAERREGTLRERLQEFVFHYITIVIDTPDLARILFREVMGGGERARETVVEHFSDSFRRLAAVLASAEDAGELQARDPTFLAYSLFGMATMFIAGHFVVDRPLDVVALSEQIVQLFYQGVGTTC